MQPFEDLIFVCFCGYCHNTQGVLKFYAITLTNRMLFKCEFSFKPEVSFLQT